MKLSAIASVAFASLFGAVLLPAQTNAQVVCTPTSSTQCDLVLNIVFEPGNVTVEVPTDTLNIPAESLTDGSTFTIDIPLNNTGSFDVANGTIAFSDLPAYITIAPIANFNLAAGASTTLVANVTVGTVPVNSASETATVSLVFPADVSGATTNFTF